MGRISREIARDMQHRTEAAIEGELAKRPPVMHFPRTLPWLHARSLSPRWWCAIGLAVWIAMRKPKRNREDWWDA